MRKIEIKIESKNMLQFFQDCKLMQIISLMVILVLILFGSFSKRGFFLYHFQIFMVAITNLDTMFLFNDLRYFLLYNLHLILTKLPLKLNITLRL